MPISILSDINLSIVLRMTSIVSVSKNSLLHFADKTEELVMDAISRIITVLLVPLGIMNMLGGLISGIWLAFLGHWGLIGYGFLIIAFASFGIGFAMMPSLLFAVPAMSLIEKGNKFFGYIFLLLSTLYKVDPVVKTIMQ